VYEQDGKRLVDVPNVLLQSTNQLHAFAYIKGEGDRYTMRSKSFFVLPRSKPDDYVYTETEVWTAEKAVAEALEEAKASGAFKGEKGDKGDKGDPGEPGGGQSYVLPIATPDTLGGVQPITKTDAMTQSVGVDETGGLWTAPGGGSSELPFINKLVTTEEATYIELSTDANGNAFDITEIEMFVHIPNGVKAITVNVFANKTLVNFGTLQAKTDGGNVFHLQTHRSPNWQTIKTGAYGSPQYDTGWSDVVKYVKEPAHITSVGIANWSSITIPVGTILEVYGR
jgi:hypothetical protein